MIVSQICYVRDRARDGRALTPCGVIFVTPDTASCMSCPVCVRVRSLARFEPLTPRKYPGKSDTSLIHGACDGKNTWSDFNGLQGDQPYNRPIPWRESYSAFPTVSPRVGHAD